MPHPNCLTSSSIGPCPDLHKNFLNRAETVSIYWDDAIVHPALDNAFYKVVHQCEPPDVLDIRDTLIQVHRFYDLILAFDERVLRECSNAVFLTESACSWLPRKWNAIDPFGNMNYDGVQHKNPVVMNYEGCDVSAKRFEVSFLTSSKNQSPGHKLRHEIYDRLPQNYESGLKVFKHKSPPIVPDKRTVLEPYMFSIVPENSKHSGYYTEKIVDCFVAKTIPIYWGCTNLANFFNMDGVILIEDCNDLLSKLNTLTPEYYASRRSAVEDNFQRALRGVHQWDLIENAITEGIEKKKREGSGRIEPAPTVVKRQLRRR